MKHDLTLNLFWAVVWAVVLFGCVLGYFWKPAIIVVGIVAAIMFVMFVCDFVKAVRMK